jgi:hypothetical protein
MEINIPLFQGLSLKISDTLEGKMTYPTGRLQKGFLLLDQGQGLAEEAVGFGLPVLKRGLQTIFPGSAALTCVQRDSTWEITALFKLNLVEKISRGRNENVENRLLYAIKNFLAAGIRRLPMLRDLLTTTSNKLRQIFNWETTYADAGFSIEVKMIYTIEAKMGKVTVEIDTSVLPPHITEVVVMNEQGAHHFDRYLDTSGVFLQGNEIGCWDEVNAKEARFESSARQVAFRLGQVKSARLFSGRELIDSRLAWAGFGYSFPPSIKKLRYEMRIERLA